MVMQGRTGSDNYLLATVLHSQHAFLQVRWTCGFYFTTILFKTSGEKHRFASFDVRPRYS
jgi:hypothetical protein